MIINVDIDNTVNDFLDVFCKYFAQVTNNSFQNIKECMTVYSISDAVKVPNECLQTLFFNNNNFYSKLKPLAHAQHVIQQLIQEKHDVRFVTAISYEVIDSRVDFVRHYFPYINIDKSLIVTNDKNSIYADIVVDDYENNLHNINPLCLHILYNQPWNQGVSVSNMVRCHNWEEVKVAIQRHCNYHKNNS